MLWFIQESLLECGEEEKQKQQHEDDIETGTTVQLAVTDL